MANVGFKLGTQAKVDALLKTPGTSVVEGSFYLTSDTHRLYIGQKATASDTNAQLFPVNEGVITVANVANLPTVSESDKPVYAGRFYYVTNGNILCVYNGKSWVQINTNTDTVINSHSYSIDGGTITDNIHLSNGKDQNATFTVTGANGVQISGTGTTLTITGDKYSLSSTVASNKATVKLDSANTTNDTSVVLAGGENVTITQDAGTKEVTIKSNNTKLTSLTGAAVENGEGFTITGNNSDGSKATAATINPQIKVGKTTQPVAKFVNGTATLDVYSTKDIDDKMKALNAMVYKGTLGKAGTVKTLPTTNICIGDTYLAAENVTINEHTVYAGSLIIARGTEDASGFITTESLVWDIVESTKDADTQYNFQTIEGGIKLHSSTGRPAGQLVINGGTDVAVATASSDASADQTLTVNHKAVARADSADPDLSQTKNASTDVTVITGVTTSETGHVTGVKTRKIKLVDSNTTLKSISNAVTAASNIATVTSTVKGTLGAGADTSATGTFKVASTSMTVTGSSNQVNIDLTWGTF